MIMHRVIAIFKGRVQGVGFRASTKMIAHELGLVGYVQNMPDGTVKLVAEAEKSALERFLRIMKSKEILGERIVENLDVSYGESTGEFDKFEIRK